MLKSRSGFFISNLKIASSYIFAKILLKKMAWFSPATYQTGLQIRVGYTRKVIGQVLTLPQIPTWKLLPALRPCMRIDRTLSQSAFALLTKKILLRISDAPYNGIPPNVTFQASVLLILHKRYCWFYSVNLWNSWLVIRFYSCCFTQVSDAGRQANLCYGIWTAAILSQYGKPLALYIYIFIFNINLDKPRNLIIIIIIPFN